MCIVSQRHKQCKWSSSEWVQFVNLEQSLTVNSYSSSLRNSSRWMSWAVFTLHETTQESSLVPLRVSKYPEFQLPKWNTANSWRFADLWTSYKLPIRWYRTFNSWDVWISYIWGTLKPLHRANLKGILLSIFSQTPTARTISDDHTKHWLLFIPECSRC